MNEKIWITGAKGMLGQELSALASQHSYHTILSDIEVDITNESSVESFIEKHQPSVLVNCAAYTAVDLAETEKDLNYKINATGPQVLGKVLAPKNIPILHISTDYVLNGKSPNPLRPSDAYSPVNEYGKAKMQGELFLKESGASVWILRTAWLYGIHGKNFVKTMLHLMQNKEELRVIHDQFGNPTWTLNLAEAILQIIQSKSHFGTYHYTGDGITSWYDFAKAIQKLGLQYGLLSKSIPIHPVSSSEFVTPAKRPLWSALSKTEVQETFGVQVPHWKEALKKYIQLESTHAPD